MSSVQLFAWCFLGIVALAYCVIPLFLRGLRAQCPTVFSSLGQPRVSQVFSRDLTNWKTQFRVIGFVLSGRGFASTHGFVRVLAVFAWLAYAGMFFVLVWFVFLAATNAPP